MTTTNLARLITDAMQPERLTLGEIERRGGPNKAALSYLLRKWTGARNVDPVTLDQLSHALRISRRSLGRAAAVDMGLLPGEDAMADDLALLTDALRERASEDQREVVVASARAVWRVLEDRRDIRKSAVVRGRYGVGKTVIAGPGAAAEPEQLAARTSTPEFEDRLAADQAGEPPHEVGAEHGA